MLSDNQKLKMERAVKRGIKVLNQAKPGWYKRNVISLRRLKLQSCQLCVLGQTYATDGSSSGYHKGLAELGRLAKEGEIKLPRGVKMNHDWVDGETIGCSLDNPDVEAWAYLRSLWAEEIKKHRAKRVVAA